MEQIEKRISDPTFWENQEDSKKKLLQKRSQIEESLKQVEGFQTSLGDSEALIELLDEGEEVAPDLKAELSQLDKDLSETELKTLLSGPHDRNNSIVTIHPGAGGTESQDL